MPGSGITIRSFARFGAEINIPILVLDRTFPRYKILIELSMRRLHPKSKLDINSECIKQSLAKIFYILVKRGRVYGGRLLFNLILDSIAISWMMALASIQVVKESFCFYPFMVEISLNGTISDEHVLKEAVI